MKSIQYEKINCPLCKCDGNKSQIIFSSHDDRYGHTEIFNVVKCKNCGFVYVNPRLNVETITEWYTKDYSSDGLQKQIPKGSKRRVRAIWHKISGNPGVEYIDVKGRVLEIGCNQGQLIEYFKNKGLEVHGVEINPEAVKICRENSLNVFCGDLIEAQYPDDFFDTVILSNVIEHIYSLDSLLKELKRILKKGGKIYIYTMNYESIWRSIFKSCWIHWHLPFHIYFFHTDSLSKVLKTHGFVILEARSLTPTNWFTLSLFLTIQKKIVRKNITYICDYRRSFVHSLIMRIFFSPFIRIIDILLKRGDCLIVEAGKYDT